MGLAVRTVQRSVVAGSAVIIPQLEVLANFKSKLSFATSAPANPGNQGPTPPPTHMRAGGRGTINAEKEGIHSYPDWGQCGQHSSTDQANCRLRPEPEIAPQENLVYDTLRKKSQSI